MEECTFQPTINRKNNASRSRGRSSDLQPKGFESTIERMRKGQLNKEIKKQQEQKILAGERYDKETLERMKPPSFLGKVALKKKILLSIEVSISPIKTGRIVIKEDDDVRQAAFNFCKAYSLSKQMQMTLVTQLETHLRNYYKQKMLDQILKKTIKNVDTGPTINPFSQILNEDDI